VPAWPRWREARELAQAQAQRREAELRLSVLAAQVEPHFLFNTLAGVRSAISTDPARASDMVDRLADYLRAAIPRLRSDGGAQATLGSQLDIVRAYLGLMAARMPRLHFDIDVPTELLAAACPPLMLISLAENAVQAMAWSPRSGRRAWWSAHAARRRAGCTSRWPTTVRALRTQHQRHRPGPGQHPRKAAADVPGPRFA
jgi:hypothetical protein